MLLATAVVQRTHPQEPNFQSANSVEKPTCVSFSFLLLLLFGSEFYELDNSSTFYLDYNSYNTAAPNSRDLNIYISSEHIGLPEGVANPITEYLYRYISETNCARQKREALESSRATP